MPLVFPPASPVDSFHILAIRCPDSAAAHTLMIFLKGHVTNVEVTAFINQAQLQGVPPRRHEHFEHTRVAIDSYAVVAGNDPHITVSRMFPPLNCSHNVVPWYTDQCTFFVEKHIFETFLQEPTAVMSLVYSSY